MSEDFSVGRPNMTELNQPKEAVKPPVQKEIISLDGQMVVVREGVDKVTFLPALQDALKLVPEEIRKGVIVSLYAEYPDNKSQTYEQGGAFGRVSKVKEKLFVQIFPNAYQSKGHFLYTVGHEFGEVAHELIPAEERKAKNIPDHGLEKELWVDTQARSWGFQHPKEEIESPVLEKQAA